MANTKQKSRATGDKSIRFPRGRIRIVVTIVALAVAAGGAWRLFNSDAAPGPRPQNVLLITIDTLRADALGAYGNSRANTPWLDRLAAGGVRFDRARAHNVVTLPSHVNILTGRLPPDHGVRDNAGFRVAASEETLATRLKARGFRTAAFVSAFPVDSRFGLARGFEVYDDRFVDAMPRPAFLEQERAGTETVAAALRWLDAQQGPEPWFCWVHVYEPHFPYAPPEPFAGRFAGEPYAGEVAATDAALGPLLKPSLDRGTSTSTLVIVTSDHGESLGEHGEATHGVFAYEATLRVPLVLYYPPLLNPRAVDTAVSHVDILPTVLDALGMPAVAGLRGRSLMEIARNGDADDTATYFEALSGSLNRGWAPLSGVVADGMKYIDLPIPELYDLRADPQETRNTATSNAVTNEHPIEYFRRLLRSFEGGVVRRVDETVEVKDRLRALGYVASNPTLAPRRYSEVDDPKRLIGLDRQLQEVVDLHMSGNLPDALARCRGLLKQRPDMRVALLTLAHLEREAGNLPSAIAALRHALEVNPGDSEAASLLGAYLTAANRPLEAIELLKPYAAQTNADTQVLVALSLAQARARGYGDALSTLDRARAQDPSNAMLLVNIGTVELMAGKRPQARKAFEDALGLNPDVARAHSSLGALAAEEGRRDEALSHWRRAVALDPSEYEKLLAIAVTVARHGPGVEAQPYFQLFADGAPPARYAADVAKVQRWLSQR